MEGQEIIIRERSLLKDYSYVTREIRCGTVLALYPYHFLCQMADGTKESFRYNEFLGREARLIRIKKERQCAASLFLWYFIHRTGRKHPAVLRSCRNCT